jgi:predicted ATPase/class 3 adenylate cyclase
VTNAGSVLPTGTITSVFTDIEGSTDLVQRLGPAFKDVLETHNAIMLREMTNAGGTQVRNEGDSFFIVFQSIPAAAQFVTAAQKALVSYAWPDGIQVRVRMGLHTGDGVLGGDSYVGIDVHRAARIASVAHGGQVLLSGTTANLLENSVSGVMLRNLGDHMLKDLTHPERIYQLIIPGLPEDFPPLHTHSGVPNNLPTNLTRFIGRDRELKEVIKLMVTTRLLTLTGPGGAGKTRLGLKAAVVIIDQYPDGVYFVNLAPVEDPGLLPVVILEALGLPQSTGVSPKDHLFHFLSGRRMLLILDNFEKLISSSPFVAELLQRTAEIKVIVTSRAALRINGEQKMPVPPLDVPDSAFPLAADTAVTYDAVALFVDRATAVRPDFTLDQENVKAVAELVVRLDGMPLAIELAASRLNVFPPKTLLERLDFRILASGARDLPDRQKSLYNTITWSYELLDEPCKRLFENLSVFVNGAMLEQIESVCGSSEEMGADIVEDLTKLVECSLVRQPGLEDNPRYRMFMSIQEFAKDKLKAPGAIDALRGRHALAYLDLAEQASSHLTRHDRARWLDRLAMDHDNLRAALSWMVEQQEANQALRLVSSLWRFWQMRGHLFEARELVEKVIDLPDQDPALRAKALEAAGGVAYWKGELETARGWYQEALNITRRLNDRLAIANALYNLAFPLGFTGEFQKGLKLLNESLGIFQDLRDETGIARSHWGLGNMLVNYNDLAKARKYFQMSVEEFENLDEPFGLGWAHFMLAETLIRLDILTEVRPHLKSGLHLFLEAGDLSAIVLFLNAYAALAFREKDNNRAYRLLGAMMELHDRTGTDLLISDEVPLTGFDLAALESLDSESAAIFSEGRKMPLQEAVAYAIEG